MAVGLVLVAARRFLLSLAGARKARPRIPKETTPRHHRPDEDSDGPGAA